MKKLLTALTALALVLSFAACGKQETPVQTTNDTTTAATTEVTTEAATEATTENTTASEETTGSSAIEIIVTDAPAESTEASKPESTAEVTESTTVKPPVTTSATTEVTTEATTATTTEATTEATTETTAPETPAAEDNAALTVLKAIWDAYPADSKFASFGGDVSNAVMDAPGAMSLDAASMDRTLGFPQDSVEKIDACASLVHMLNANTFTCGAYRVKDGEDAAALAEAIRSNVQGRRWMCGYPDTIRILTVGDTLVALFGNNSLADTFVEAAKSAYPDLTVTVSEPIQ